MPFTRLALGGLLAALLLASCAAFGVAEEAEDGPACTPRAETAGVGEVCGKADDGCGTLVEVPCTEGSTCRKGAGLDAGTCELVTCEGIACGAEDAQGRRCLASCWSWSSPDVAPPPPPRADHSLVALPGEPGAPRVVLFGGKSCSNPTDCTTGDTYLFDGQGWSRLDVAGPSPRYEHGAVLVPGGGAIPDGGGVLLFGGTDGTNVHGDLWLFDGTSWTELSPAGTGPAARYAFGFAHEPSRRRVLLFGGVLADQRTVGELWALSLDELSWQRLEPAGVAPEARKNAVFAHDPVAGRTLLFSGSFDGPALDDGFVFDGSTWIELDAAELPSPRGDAAAAFDESRSSLVIFGGNGPRPDEPRGDLGETLVVSFGADGRPRFEAQPLSDAATLAEWGIDGLETPSARDQAPLASLPGGGVLLVGGQPGKAQAGDVADDTWLFRPYTP